MPTYDYDCPQCGSFDALRSVSMRNQAAACPACGGPCARILSVAPSLALMEDGARRAMDTNERARHEPKRSGDYARLEAPGGLRLLLKRQARRHADRAQRQQSLPEQTPLDDQPLAPRSTT